MILAELNLSIRDINAISRAGCTTVEELRQKISDDMDGMKRQLGFATFDRIEDALSEIQTDVPAVVLENPESHARACYLRDDTKARLSVIELNYYEVCKNIKEMRDNKLYKELGYQTFEDCCKTEFGLAKRQCYKYISIAENLSADFVQSTAQIGTEKLSLLAMLDEPEREKISESVDLENTTVKELKAQISALQNEKNRLESENADIGQKLDAATESKNRDLKRISQEKIEISENLRKKSAEFVKAQNRIMSLEKQIKELENRPVEVAVSEDETKEIERLKAELEDTKLRLTQADKNATAKAERAAALVRDEYEEKLANAQRAETDQNALDKEKFEALRVMFEHSCDELEYFLEDLEDDPRIDYVAKLKSYFRKTIMRLIIPGEGA